MRRGMQGVPDDAFRHILLLVTKQMGTHHWLTEKRGCKRRCPMIEACYGWPGKPPGLQTCPFSGIREKGETGGLPLLEGCLYDVSGLPGGCCRAWQECSRAAQARRRKGTRLKSGAHGRSSWGTSCVDLQPSDPVAVVCLHGRPPGLHNQGQPLGNRDARHP